MEIRGWLASRAPSAVTTPDGHSPIVSPEEQEGVEGACGHQKWGVEDTAREGTRRGPGLPRDYNALSLQLPVKHVQLTFKSCECPGLRRERLQTMQEGELDTPGRERKGAGPQLVHDVRAEDHPGHSPGPEHLESYPKVTWPSQGEY